MPESNARHLELVIGRVDLGTGQIHDAAGNPLDALPPRQLSLLCYLVDRREQAVSRDDLLKGVWGHLEAGSEDSVNVAISGLRKALGDQQRPNRVIATLPRRGYRYVGPPPTDGPVPAPSAQPGDGPVADAPAGRRTLLFAGTAALILALFAWLLREGPTPGANPAPAESANRAGIAVLPFLDLSQSGDQEPFADALVDSILHMLAQVPDLRVVARTSSFMFRDRDAPIPEIAAELRVRTILEGSVQRDSDRIRVTAQLVNDEGDHLWSRVYDRRANDLFDVQDEIAAEVSRQLHRTLAPASTEPKNLKAFQQLARGRHAYRQETLQGARAALAHFERALELAPDNIDATIGLAEALAQQGRLSRSAPSQEELASYAALISGAYERAPDNPEAVRLRGDLAFLQGDREAAENYYRRAVALGPSYAAGYAALGRTLWRRGAFDEALDQLRVAHDLDPLSDMVTALLVDAYWSVGRAEEALARLRENIERNPDFPRYHDRMASYLAQIGRSGDAMRWILAARELDPDSGYRAFRVCEFHNQLGDVDEAEACADRLEAEHRMPQWVLYLRQQIAVFRGERERARALLHQLVREAPQMELIPALSAMVDASAGACAASLELLSASYPGLFADPPTARPTDVLAALTAVHCLRDRGRDGDAAALLDVAGSILARTRIARGPQYAIGLEESMLLVLQGRREAALDAFERLVDGGWRYYWWGLDLYPMLAPIRDEPAFRAAVERLHAGVEEQRAWFEEHQDEPLF